MKTPPDAAAIEEAEIVALARKLAPRPPVSQRGAFPAKEVPMKMIFSRHSDARPSGRSILGRLSLALPLLLAALAVPTVILAATDPAAVVVTAAPAADAITIPVASWVDQVAVVVRDVGTAGLPILLGWVLTLLPAPIRVIAGPFLQKYSSGIFDKALDYGVNAVKGATKDGDLTIPVANKVLAHTAQYAIEHGPAWWLKAMGGEDGIRQKIFARLNLPKSAGIEDFDTQVAPVVATAPSAVKTYRLPQGGK